MRQPNVICVVETGPGYLPEKWSGPRSVVPKTLELAAPLGLFPRRHQQWIRARFGRRNEYNLHLTGQATSWWLDLEPYQVALLQLHHPGWDKFTTDEHPSLDGAPKLLAEYIRHLNSVEAVANDAASVWRQAWEARRDKLSSPDAMLAEFRNFLGSGKWHYGLVEDYPSRCLVKPVYHDGRWHLLHAHGRMLLTRPITEILVRPALHDHGFGAAAEVFYCLGLPDEVVSYGLQRGVVGRQFAHVITNPELQFIGVSPLHTNRVINRLAGAGLLSLDFSALHYFEDPDWDREMARGVDEVASALISEEILRQAPDPPHALYPWMVELKPPCVPLCITHKCPGAQWTTFPIDLEDVGTRARAP